MNHYHAEGADYDVEEADAFLDTTVPEGCRRWRCVLCGFPQGDFKKEAEIGAFCCGGCGMTCVRPIEEFNGS